MTSGNEFSLIARFRDIVGGHQRPGIVLGSGDDCAVLAPPAGQQICVSVDTLVEGAHFPVGGNPQLIGYRALAVNLSDLAAMGATPWSVFVALTMQAANDEDAVSFVEGLASGFAELANQYDVALSGGNLARGPLAISVTVMGLVPDGAFLRRDGASPGDDVYVSGDIGQAGKALADPMLAEVSPAQLGSRSRDLQYPQDHPCAPTGDRSHALS